MRLTHGLLVLCTAALLAAPSLGLAQPGGAPDYAAMDKLGWKLSCQAWTFRQLTLFEMIDTVQGLGIRFLELFPGQKISKDNPAGFSHTSSPEQIAAVQEKLKAANVTPVCYGVVGLGNDEAGARKVFEFAKTLGLLNIVSEPAEDALPMLDRLCEEYHINISIHNHPQPSHYWNSDTVLKVCEGRSKRIGSCADTGHWYRSGLVPVDCLRKLEGRVVSLHFKDLSAEKVDQPWGTGVCDAKGMLAELHRQGFKGVFSIEYESGSGPELVANVGKCVAFFSDCAAQLAAGK